MANYLYNGVELPDINEVWTDKETYPYATITISDTTAESEGAGLDFIVPLYTVILFNQEPFYYSSMDALGFNANWSTVVYAVILDSAWCEAFNNAVGQEVIIPGVWIEYGGDTDRDYTNNFSPVNGLHWTSHDIINTTDNSVYLAASEPVPVGGSSHVTESSGNGYALYNGVKLPNIDSVWTDKGSYPYAVITHWSDNASAYGLILVSATFDLSTEFYGGVDFYGGKVSINGPCAYSYYALLNGVWTFAESGTHETGYSNSYGEDVLIWSNTNIYAESDTPYLEPSNPIPLDGMTVIEWDGDSTDMTTASTDLAQLVLLSEKVPDTSKPAAEVRISDGGGTQYAYTETAKYSDLNGCYYWNAIAWHSYYPKATDVATTPGIYITSQTANPVTSSLFAFYEGTTEETTFDLKSWLIGYALGLSGKPLPITANY